MIDRLDRRTCALLFAAAALFFAAGSFWGLPSGKSVAGALVILDGGVPYRDFWTMYAPGQFYAVAALFWLFGRELLVQALAVSAIRAASAVVFFLLLRRLHAARGLALALSGVFVLMSWSTAPELTDYEPALPLVMLALERLVRYYETGSSPHLRWSGAFLGCAAWFKHDVAAYIASGIALSLALSWWAAGGRRPSSWRPPLAATMTVALFAAALAAPLALWTAWTAGAEAWEDLFIFPALVFSKVRGDQFPPLVPSLAPVAAWLADPGNAANALAAAQRLSPWAALNAPQAVFLGGVGVLIAARRRLEPPALARLLLFLACMPFFWAAAHVQHNTHPYTLAVLSAGAGIVIWAWMDRQPRWKARLRAPLLAALVVYAGGLVTTAGIDAAMVYYEWPGSRPLGLPGFRGVRVPARVHDSLNPTGTFVRARTQEGEAIYTGLLRHDAIVINNALLYAVAGRPACCGFTELHPGVADRAPVQQRIVEALEAGAVRAMVLWQFGWSADVMEARKAHTMSGVPDAGATILDRYIAEHFELVESHGEYHVLWRRGVPLPADDEADSAASQ